MCVRDRKVFKLFDVIVAWLVTSDKDCASFSAVAKRRAGGKKGEKPEDKLHWTPDRFAISRWSVRNPIRVVIGSWSHSQLNIQKFLHFDSFAVTVLSTKFHFHKNQLKNWKVSEVYYELYQFWCFCNKIFKKLAKVHPPSGQKSPKNKI